MLSDVLCKRMTISPYSLKNKFNIHFTKFKHNYINQQVGKMHFRYVTASDSFKNPTRCRRWPPLFKVPSILFRTMFPTFLRKMPKHITHFIEVCHKILNNYGQTMIQLLRPALRYLHLTSSENGYPP